MFGSKMSKVEKAIKTNNAHKLIELSGNNDMAVCLAAIAGLGKVRDDNATNFLISRLQNVEPKIRIAIAQALGMIGNVHTKAHLSAQMNKETEPEVREAFGAAMSNIKDY